MNEKYYKIVLSLYVLYGIIQYVVMIRPDNQLVAFAIKKMLSN